MKLQDGNVALAVECLAVVRFGTRRAPPALFVRTVTVGGEQEKLENVMLSGIQC